MTTHTIAPTGAVSKNVQRRSLFAGAAALAAMTAVAAPLTQCSPIIRAGMGIKACWAKHDAADDRDDRQGVIAASEEKRLHEEFILASSPTTLAECALVLMVAAAEIDFGQNVDDGYDIIDAGERACERVTRSLFALAEVDMSDFSGQFYVRPDLMGKA